METFSTIIIGCGPGGMEAATRLARGGQKIAVVESGAWGGTCLNCGCIPTKMLLGAIEPLRLLHPLIRRKLATGEETINYQALQARVQRHVRGVSASIVSGLESAGVTLYSGKAEFIDRKQLKIAMPDGSATITGENIVIATGSSPAVIPGLQPDHEVILDSTDLMFVSKPPESLVIIGAGAIGLELADFFNALGSRITLVEAAPQIAPAEDEDIAGELQQALTRLGYMIHTGTGARNLRALDGRAQLELTDGSTLEAEKALVAIGRAPNTGSLGLDKAGISVNRKGFIETDGNLEAAPGVYAIGDVNGRILLAHAATHQGAYVAGRILGRTASEYYAGVIPSCIYCHPAIMRAGMSEKDALRRGQTEISKSMLSQNAIAQSHCETGGYVKAVWSSGSLAGLAAIGHGVTSLVTAAELLVAGKYQGQKLDEIMIAHPTMAESLAWAIQAQKTSVREKD